MRTNWLIVRTVAGSEQRVVELLAKRGIRAYAPTNRVTDGKKRDGVRPLIEGTIFVDSVVPPSGWHIIGPIWFRAEQATVTYEEIQALRMYVSHNTNVIIIKVPVRQNVGSIQSESGCELPSLGIFISHHAELFLINKERARSFAV